MLLQVPVTDRSNTTDQGANRADHHSGEDRCSYPPQDQGRSLHHKGEERPLRILLQHAEARAGQQGLPGQPPKEHQPQAYDRVDQPSPLLRAQGCGRERPAQAQHPAHQH